MFGAEDDGMQFQPDGYLLMFHPDLLRNTPLGRIMREYSFFSYETNEALHLSVEERQIIMDCFHNAASGSMAFYSLFRFSVLCPS